MLTREIQTSPLCHTHTHKEDTNLITHQEQGSFIGKRLVEIEQVSVTGEHSHSLTYKGDTNLIPHPEVYESRHLVATKQRVGEFRVSLRASVIIDHSRTKGQRQINRRGDTNPAQRSQ